MICDATGKVCYPTEKAAKRAIRMLRKARKDGGGFMHAYLCGGHWHAGHATKRGIHTKKRRTR